MSAYTITHVLYLTYKEVSVGLSVVSYSRKYLWANLDETLQGDPGAPSDEHGVVDSILKRLYFVFYVIIKIIIMAAFFHLDTSITPTTVLSVH